MTRITDCIDHYDLVVSTDERVTIEKMRIDITEKTRDIGQLCRRIEQIAKRRTS